MKKESRRSNNKQPAFDQNANRKAQVAAACAYIRRQKVHGFSVVPALTAQRLQRLIEQHLQEVLNEP